MLSDEPKVALLTYYNFFQPSLGSEKPSPRRSFVDGRQFREVIFLECFSSYCLIAEKRTDNNKKKTLGGPQEAPPAHAVQVLQTKVNLQGPAPREIKIPYRML